MVIKLADSVWNQFIASSRCKVRNDFSATLSEIINALRTFSDLHCYLHQEKSVLVPSTVFLRILLFVKFNQATWLLYFRCCCTILWMGSTQKSVKDEMT